MRNESVAEPERPLTSSTALATTSSVVVIGAAANRLPEFMQLAHTVPRHMPAALLAVVHAPSDHSTSSADALLPEGAVDMAYADDGDTLTPGRLVLAPPGARHLLVEPPGTVRLVFGPRENDARPSIDVLFRSAARAFGSRVVGVLLPGDDADGLEGLSVIHAHGGRTVMLQQERQPNGDAHLGQLDAAQIDHLLSLAEIGSLLAHVAQRSAEQHLDSNAPVPAERAASMSSDAPAAQRENEASGFVCPECHGSLWEILDGPLLTYTCRAGHMWSDTSSLVVSQAEDLERIAWRLLGALDERAALLQRLVALSTDPTSPVTTQAKGTAAHAAALARIVREALPTIL